MSQPSQVSAAVTMGVDAIGVIFYEKSPRCLSIEQARLVRAVVPAFVSLVGVFVNEDIDTVNAISTEVGLDLIQLHGNETRQDADRLIKPYLRAIQVKNSNYVLSQIELHKNARGYLLDSYSDTQYGGTGAMLDSQSLPLEMPDHMIYAGGISPSTIGERLRSRPYAIDVNSGVEISPGVKDIDKLKKLIDLVRQHDAVSSK